jgi:hypothetical protein
VPQQLPQLLALVGSGTSSLFNACVEACGPQWFLPLQFIGTYEAVAIEKCLKANAATRDPAKLKLETLYLDLMPVRADQRTACP